MGKACTHQNTRSGTEIDNVNQQERVIIQCSDCYVIVSAGPWLPR